MIVTKVSDVTAHTVSGEMLIRALSLLPDCELIYYQGIWYVSCQDLIRLYPQVSSNPWFQNCTLVLGDDTFLAERTYQVVLLFDFYCFAMTNPATSLPVEAK